MESYVLIDAAGHEGVPQAIVYYRQGMPCRSLFARRPGVAPDDGDPWLLQLPETGVAACVSWLMTVERTTPIVSWLASDAPFDEVYAHLERLAHEVPPGRSAPPRFWDNRVFLRLQSELSPSQRGALLGPVDVWRVHDGEQYARMRRPAGR